MIRTAFAVLFLVASSAAAHANVPAQHDVQAAKAQAFSIADCSIPLRSTCGERDVSRGHADLAPRYVAPANAAPSATA